MLKSVLELTNDKDIQEFVASKNIMAIVPPEGPAYAVRPSNPREKRNLQALGHLLHQKRGTVKLVSISEAQYKSKIEHLKPARSRQKKKEEASNLCKELIYEAAKAEASDIHIKVTTKDTRIRFRVHGNLRHHDTIGALVGQQLLTVMYNVHVGHPLTKEEARDDTFYVDTAIGRYMCRINLMMTAGGDENQSGEEITPRKVVIRISRTDVVPNISSAGYTAIQQLRTKEMMYSAQGLMIISGAVNSGKTTSLLGLIQDIGDDSSILDISESVEIQLPGVDHVELPSVGSNQAELEERRQRVIKSSVRQDSDYLMIGEVRDKTTANIASYMALQGKFVFTTAHSTDALACYRRLISEDDFGITESKVLSPRFMVGIINQSLVEGLCPHCAMKEFQGTGHDELDKATEDRIKNGFKQYSKYLRYRNQKGCNFCNWTGVKGRQLLAEMMPFDDFVKDALVDGRHKDIVSYQIENGYETKHTHAIKKCLSGLVDPTSVIKKIGQFTDFNCLGIWGDEAGLGKAFNDRSDNVHTELKRQSLAGV